MSEQWLPVVGYEGMYEVSDLGRVKSLARLIRRRGGCRVMSKEMILKNRRLNSGYGIVGLAKDGKKKDFSVHSLVLKAFVGERPEGMYACHNNGDSSDNRLSNLRWDTQSANLLDTVKHGTHPSCDRTHCVNGHEYTPENTLRQKNGYRSCRECARIRSERNAVPGPGRHADKTHCPYGHEYTPENTMSAPGRAKRSCRACQAIQRRAKYAASVAAQGRQVNQRKSHRTVEVPDIPNQLSRVRIDPKLWKAVADKARADEHSLAGVIRDLLTGYIEDQGATPRIHSMSPGSAIVE